MGFGPMASSLPWKRSTGLNYGGNYRNKFTFSRFFKGILRQKRTNLIIIPEAFRKNHQKVYKK